jgi:hypothetical protein
VETFFGIKCCSKVEHNLFQNESVTEATAVFCEWKNNINQTVNIFVKNVTDPVGEFWEKKALEQTGGVGDSFFITIISITIILVINFFLASTASKA